MRRCICSMILVIAILFGCLTAFASDGKSKASNKKDLVKIKEKFGTFQNYLRRRPDDCCYPRPTWEPRPTEKPEKKKNNTCRSDIPKIPSVFETEYESEDPQPTVEPTPTPALVTTIIYEVPAEPEVVYVYKGVPKTGDETKGLCLPLLLLFFIMPVGIISFAKKSK